MIIPVKTSARTQMIDITAEVRKAVKDSGILNGLVHVYSMHTTAAVTINENADPTVRDDFEAYFNRLAPEDAPYYTHTYEGSDDLPAHLKSSLLGTSVSLPITNGRPNLGTWQGIYLCEHRNHGGARTVVVTVQGE